VDSVYYYTHGIEPKNDFVIDTTKIHKVNSVISLHLDNGKDVKFIDNNTNDANMVYYRYEGENKKFGFYLLDRSMADLYFKLMINEKNGEIDTLNNVSIFSPSFIYYASINPYNDQPGSFIVFKNIKSKKSNRIEFIYGPNYGLKWVDDKSFLFYFVYWDKPDVYWTPNTYYLVQIKK
jgi:hypothetical protein